MQNIYAKLFVVLVLTLFGTVLSAQNDNSMYFSNEEKSPLDSNKLILRITDVNFLKNNEYFNPIVDGYTYLGYFIQPKLVYYPTSNTKVEAGLHLLKFSGRDDYTQVQPLFSFSYKPSKDLTFIIGTIKGTVNHKLIEPISLFDRYYENNVENGMQLLIDKKHFKTDFWLDWEKFILKTDHTKEQFTFGGSANLYLTAPDAKNIFFLPLQYTFAHKGGQYLGDTIPIQTVFNSATGFVFEHLFNSNFFYSVGTKNYYCTYSDLSNIHRYKYELGWGESSNIFINTKYVYLMLGYWYSEFFIAPKGEPLFGSNSIKYNYYDTYRNLLTGKVQFKKNIAKGIDIGIRFEYYYEYSKSNFDYSYGVNLDFNRDFFLTTIPLK